MLALEVAEVLDVEAVASAVVKATVDARKALGVRARRSAVTDDDRRRIKALGKLGPLLEVRGEVLDLRTTAGLRRAWVVVVERKLEELRRRSSRMRTDPALLGTWLRLSNLDRDAQQLLADGDEYDAPAARDAAGRPPTNPTDLSTYANLTGDLP